MFYCLYIREMTTLPGFFPPFMLHCLFKSVCFSLNELLPTTYRTWQKEVPSFDTTVGRALPCGQKGLSTL